MGRSHAWVRRGQELVEPRPTNWGPNLPMIGAIRQDQWVTLSTKWRAVTKVTFTVWVRQRLAPRLRPGDIVVLDNLRAHMDPAVRTLVEARGAPLRFLPPYSYDFNPIEAAWGQAHPKRCAPHGTCVAPRRASRAPCGHTASLSAMVHARWLRQLKYHPGLGTGAFRATQATSFTRHSKRIRCSWCHSPRKRRPQPRRRWRRLH